MNGSILLTAWVFEIKICWDYIEATRAHCDCMDILIWWGDEDITDDLSDEDFEIVKRLCYADKELEENYT